MVRFYYCYFMKEENQGSPRLNAFQVTEGGFPPGSPALCSLVSVRSGVQVMDKMPNVLCERLTDSFLRGGNVPGWDQDTIY